MTEKLGARRAVLAVALAGALVTYGGVSLFVAFPCSGPLHERTSVRCGTLRAFDVW